MLSYLFHLGTAFFLGISVCIWGLCTISRRHSSTRDPASSFLGMLLTLIPLSIALYLFILAQQHVAYAG